MTRLSLSIAVATAALNVLAVPALARDNARTTGTAIQHARTSPRSVFNLPVADAYASAGEATVVVPFASTNAGQFQGSNEATRFVPQY